MDDNNISEDILYYTNLAEAIDHKCDENGTNLLNTEKEADVTSIDYINETNDTSMMKILSINMMQHFICQITMNMYLLDQNMIQKDEYFFLKQFILDLLL